MLITIIVHLGAVSDHLTRTYLIPAVARIAYKY